MVEFGKYLSIFLLSMLKFIFGPTMGTAAGMSLVETVLLTVGGMMASVFIISYFGTTLRAKVFSRISMNKKLFTKRNRNLVKIWNNYGLFGVALLTPIIFTPIGGTLFAVAMGTPRRKIFSYMFFSGMFWAIIITLAIQLIIPLFK